MFTATLLSLTALGAAIPAPAPASTANPINLQLYFASKTCQFTTTAQTLSTAPGCHQFSGVVESFVTKNPNAAYQLVAYADQTCSGPSETYHLDFDGCNAFDAANYAQSYCIPQLGSCP